MNTKQNTVMADEFFLVTKIVLLFLPFFRKIFL
jgi:hypothetical protein